MVTLRNLGNQAAQNVSAKLRSGNALFAITDSTSAYGDIPTGTSRSNDADRLAAFANGSMPSGTTVACTLLIHSDDLDRDWTCIFNLVVGVPHVPPAKILIVHTDSNRPDSLIRVLTDLGDTVEVFDARTANPTLGQLQPYDGAIVYSRTAFRNAADFGNILADYVDLGRALVVANFALTTGLCPQGRVMTESGYVALKPGGINPVSGNLGWCYPNHEILAGIGTVTDIYRSQTTLGSGADSVAKWDDGKFYIATSANQRVVAINQNPGGSNQSRMIGRDWARVYHQAIAWARASMTGLESKTRLSLGSPTIAGYPNPLRNSTVLTCFLTEAREVELSVLDAAGRKVKSLVSGRLPAGFVSATWNRTDAQARPVPAGIYFCVLSAGPYRTSCKLIAQ